MCVHETMEKKEVWNERYKGFDMPRWDFSDADMTLTFSEAGKPRVICDVLMVGSTLNGRWQWSWGNKNTDERNRVGLQPVFDFGEHRQWSALTTLFQDADNYTGWECASVAAHLLDGQATYRFAYGDNKEYFAYLVILRTQRVQ